MSTSRHRPLNFPETRQTRNTGRASGTELCPSLSLKKKKKHPIYYSILIIFTDKNDNTLYSKRNMVRDRTKQKSALQKKKKGTEFCNEQKVPTAPYKNQKDL